MKLRITGVFGGIILKYLPELCVLPVCRLQVFDLRDAESLVPECLPVRLHDLWRLLAIDPSVQNELDLLVRVRSRASHLRLCCFLVLSAIRHKLRIAVVVAVGIWRYLGLDAVVLATLYSLAQTILRRCFYCSWYMVVPRGLKTCLLARLVMVYCCI